MIQKLKLHIMQDVSDVVCILVKNNYICEAKAVYKKFPEDEHSIDFFRFRIGEMMNEVTRHENPLPMQ